jgi:hypothetical protein
MQCVFIQDNVRKKTPGLLPPPPDFAWSFGLPEATSGRPGTHAAQRCLFEHEDEDEHDRSPLTSHPFDALDACSGQASRISNAPYRSIPVFGH